jgi:cystathionine gamma-synthase
VGGAVICNNQELLEQLIWWANCLGLTGAPFDSFQTLRGLRTLAVRYRQHQENACLIAEALKDNELVDKIYFPGLTDHPGHELACRQQLGFGAMISFELDALEQEIPVFLDALQLFTLAESLGGVESLVAHPASMTHAAMSAEDQATAGITNRLLRLSVGIEHVDDLLADLANGFAAIERSRFEVQQETPELIRNIG